MNSFPFLNPHELTPLCSPSLLRKEGETNYDSVLYTPSLRSREGAGGEFVGKVILVGAILSNTE
jgi:hypothetical protein